ncbi:MAG: autotransporter-associated beta strand repeat-containing protein [Rubrivivax sp.]
MHRPKRRAARPASALTALALLVAGIGAAQAQTWTGTGFSNNWSDRFNWQGAQAPVSSASTALTFAGGARLSPVQNFPSVFTLNSLSFSATAGAFAISGNALRFDGNDARLQQNSGSSISVSNDIQLATNLLVEGSGNLTLEGSLSRAPGLNRDTLALTKRGTGNLVLARASLYDATVRIEAGQVQLRDALALQNAHVALDIDNGLSFGILAQATLGNLSGSGALALGTTALTLDGNDMPPGLYSGNVTGTTGSITKAGNGTARWSGTSQFRALQVQAGRMQLEGGALTLTDSDQGLMVGNGSAAGSNGPVLAMSNGATASTTGWTAQVDGADGTLLSITGAGTRLNTGGFQTLVGNAATGAVQIADGGTLAAGTYLIFGVNSGSSGSLLIGPGGTVTGTVGLLGFGAGSSGNAEVNGSNARWTTRSLNIGGLSATHRGGSGTLTVRDAGEVRVSDELVFWTASSGVTVNGGSLHAGRLFSDGAVGTIALQADPARGAALVLDGVSNGSFAGTITGGGSLLKTGRNAQTLAGASNAFTGTTTIRGGRIVVGHQDALRGSTVQIETHNGLDPNGLPQVVLGALAGNGALALGTTQLTVGESNRDTRYTGALTGADGSWLVKKGTGTLTLGGTGSLLPTLVVEGGGGVVVDGGGLSLTSVSSEVSPLVRPALQVAAGSRVEVRNGGWLTANGDGRSSVFVDGDDSTELLIDGIGSRVNAGLQTVVGNRGLGRITVRNGGSLDGWGYLFAGFHYGSHGTVTLESGGRVSVFSTLLGAQTGSVGTLSATGAGTRLLAESVSLGALTNTPPGGTGRLEVRAGALVSVAQTLIWTAASSIEIDGGSLFTGALISGTGVGSTTLMPSAQSNAPVLTLNGFSGSFSYGGSISGDGGLLKTGGSTQVLAGSNSFTGLVQVQGGTLEMSNSRAAEYEVSGGTLRLGERNLGFAVVQAGPGGQVVYTNTTLNGGLLVGPGGHDISAVRRLVGTRVGGGTVLTPASGTTFVGVVNDGQISNFGGRTLTWTAGSNPTGTVIVGGTTSVSHFSSGGQLQVDANGVLTSTSGNLVLGGGSRTTVGAASLPGGTIEMRAGGRIQLNGGLLVNNGRIVGPLQVNFGGLAKGAGEFGTVTVGDGGRFSPGNSPGTVTSGDATWGSGGGLLVELANANGVAGLAWDLWNIDGGLSVQSGTTANSQFTVSLATLDGSDQAAPLAGFDASRAWQWLIVDTDAGIQGFDASRVALDTRGFLSPLAGGTLQLAMQDGDLYLQFAPVPEPQTWALLLGGLGVIGWVARRRRATSA